MENSLVKDQVTKSLKIDLNGVNTKEISDDSFLIISLKIQKLRNGKISKKLRNLVTVSRIEQFQNMKVDDCSYTLRDFKQRLFFFNDGSNTNQQSSKENAKEIEFDVNEVFKVEGRSDDFQIGQKNKRKGWSPD